MDDIQKKIQLAKQYGYSDEEIQSFLQQKQAAGGVASLADTAAVPESSSLKAKIGDVAMTVLKPFTGTAKTVGGAAVEAGRAGATALGAKNLYYDKQGNVVENPFLSQEELAEYSDDPEKAIRKQLGRSVEVASYGVPFGKGANFLMKATVPGFVAGATGEAGRQLQTEEGELKANEIIGSGALSSVLTTGLYGASKVPGAVRRVGKGAEKTGEKVIQSQYNLPRSEAKNVKLPEMVHRLAEWDLRHVDDVARAADEVTGGSGIVTKLTRKAVAGASPVNLDDVEGVARSIARDPDMPVGADKKFIAFIGEKVKNIRKGHTANPTDVYDLIQSLEKKAYSYGGRNVTLSQQDQAMRNSYLLVADELKDRLFIQSGADDLIAGIVQGDEVANLATKYPKIADAIRQAKTVRELRNIAEPLVKGSRAVEISELGQNLATETMGGAVKGVGKMVQNPLNIVAVPLGSNRANSVAGGLVRSAGKKLQSVSNVLPSIPVNQVTGQAAAQLPSIVQGLDEETDMHGNQYPDAQQNYNAPQEQNNLYGQPENIQHNITYSNTPGDTSQELPPIAPEQDPQYLYQWWTNAMQAGDLKAADYIKKQYDMAIAHQKNIASSPKKLSAAQTGEVAGYDAADDLLNDLNSTISTYEGVMGPLVGRGRGANPYDANAMAFKSEMKGVAQMVGRILEGGVLRQEDVPKYEAILPQITDTPEVARRKIDNVRRMVATRKEALLNQIDTYGPSSTTEGVLPNIDTPMY